VNRAPTLSLFAGVRSFAPDCEALTDQKKADFPVWSSYNGWRINSSPRGMSVPTTRPRFTTATAEQPRDATIGYVVPPSNGGRSLDRFLHSTPRDTRDRSLPVGLRGLTQSRNCPTMPENLWRLHQHQIHMSHDYPTSLTARAAHSDLAIASLAMARTARATAHETQQCDFERSRDNLRAERQFLARQHSLYCRDRKMDSCV